MRTIRFFQAADDVNGEQVKGTIAVVADVLRATSTITMAMFHESRFVIPVKTVDAAHQAAEAFDRQEVILGGERNGQSIDGFDFGNSPQEYTREAVRDKVVITTTTNGTKALVHTAAADHTVVLSFLNMSAVVEFILKDEADISAVAAGIYGEFSIEDSICCGYLMDQLVSTSPGDFELDNEAQKLLAMTQNYKNDIEKMLRESPHGQFLDELGYASDLPVCAQLDACHIVPVFSGGRINIVNNRV